MSDSEEEHLNQQEDDEDTLCKYGTQLPQYEADEIPSKKPMQVEDMVVKDENGIRRFHGAFTGGFSAGYWNTVGSKEGFTPTEFKSSRSEKASAKVLKPTDFMDEEDFSEFGIAPHKIQTKEDFGTSSTNKRRREAPSDGPIPGEPVLRNLLKPVHDKAAVRILKSMGWRVGQGIGSRQTFNEKKKTSERNRREMYVRSKYGNQQSSEDEDMSDEEITFVPDDFDPFIAKIKDNTFGLEYSGLKPSSSSSSGHVNLFEPFQVFTKSNKKFSIRGQAFGVGALEEDDEDIYAMDDMTKYDRTLESERDSRNSKRIAKPIDASIIEGFSRATINDSMIRVHSVNIPRDFEPRNWLQRKSRFDPLSKEKAKVLDIQNRHKALGLGRHDLKPAERGALINEKPSQPDNVLKKDDDDERKRKSQEASKKMLELLNSKQFESEHSKKNEVFKPFIGNPDKQERYEKYLTLKSSDQAEIDKFFNDIQPLSMSSFDREMEKKEFIQAKRMYQPLDSLIGNRFIKEVDIPKEPDVKKVIKDGKETIVVQRTKLMWKPHKNLCKLFNIPEPFGGMMFDEEEEKKKKKQSSSLFDYIGVPLNTKANFVTTPQVIPRKLTEDSSKRNEEEERRKSFLAAIEKEKSFMGKRATAKDFFDNEESTSSTGSKKDEVEATKKEAKKINIPEPPKTELEKKVAESIHKKPEEKKDLFKAIFCDSDDEDESSLEGTEAIKSSNAEGNEEDASLTEKQKSTFIESFLSTKNASEINVLRNASPPRGIFKSIFELGTSKSTLSAKEKESTKDTAPEEECYGPALPKNISLATSNDKNSSNDDDSSSSDSSLDEKLLKKLKKAKSSSKECWVEKDKVKKSKKHHKKKKSHKKSHKKHKSKK